MKRNAFTMIELIFVIVVIGVLAVVAIPKLAATRDDAKVARTSHAIATATSEIAGYAVSKGTLETSPGVYDIAQMSQMVRSLESIGEARQVNLAVPTVDFKMGSTVDCISLVITDGTTDANLTVNYNMGGDSLCQQLQSLFDASQYPMPLTGKRVQYAY